MVLDILNLMQDSRHSKYLGLPSIIGKSKNEIFAEIKEKVGRKLSGWKEKMLSMGDKEILIKVVAQAVPTYTMSYFLLPKGLCDDLESMMHNFWWGQRHQEQKITWVTWKKNVQIQAPCRNGVPKPSSFQFGHASQTSLETPYQTGLTTFKNVQGKIFSIFSCPQCPIGLQSIVCLT